MTNFSSYEESTTDWRTEEDAVMNDSRNEQKSKNEHRNEQKSKNDSRNDLKSKNDSRNDQKSKNDSRNEHKSKKSGRSKRTHVSKTKIHDDRYDDRYDQNAEERRSELESRDEEKPQSYGRNNDESESESEAEVIAKKRGGRTKLKEDKTSTVKDKTSRNTNISDGYDTEDNADESRTSENYDSRYTRYTDQDQTKEGSPGYLCHALDCLFGKGSDECESRHPDSHFESRHLNSQAPKKNHKHKNRDQDDHSGSIDITYCSTCDEDDDLYKNMIIEDMVEHHNANYQVLCGYEIRPVGTLLGHCPNEFVTEIYTCGDYAPTNNNITRKLNDDDKNSQGSITTAPGLLSPKRTMKLTDEDNAGAIPDILSFGGEIEATLSHCPSNIISVGELSEKELEKLSHQHKATHFEDTGLSQMLIVPDLSCDLNLATVTPVSMDSDIPSHLEDTPEPSLIESFESFSPLGILKNITTSWVASVDMELNGDEEELLTEGENEEKPHIMEKPRSARSTSRHKREPNMAALKHDFPEIKATKSKGKKKKNKHKKLGMSKKNMYLGDKNPSSTLE